MTVRTAVPASSSSPIPGAAHRRDAPAALAPEQCRDLLDYLAQIADPRHRRGRRHTPVTVLAVAAVLAGASSLAAIGEWAGDAPCQVLAALGVRRDPLTGTWRPPGEATVRRVLARIDADALDRAIGAWLAAQQPSPPPHPPRQAVAIDGKTLRGSGHHGAVQVHLLAAMDHTTRAVLAQTDVDAKSNEITGFQPLLDGLDLAGRVVTADAMHTQHAHADWLVTVKHAAYVLIVKANQPTLHHQLRHLPWRNIPIADHTRDRGHHRVELRGLQVTTVAGLDFHHATQAIRITRRVRSLRSRRWRTVTVYAVTSLTAAQAHPAAWIRGHWGIEALHHIRDTTFAEDASQVRTGTAPRAMASLRNLASASCAPTATATSPQRCAATPATPPDPSHSSASQPRQTDIPPLPQTCCHSSASQAHEPVIPALAEALVRTRPSTVQHRPTRRLHYLDQSECQTRTVHHALRRARKWRRHSAFPREGGGLAVRVRLSAVAE
jgi:predicted transposase YbfD/YdcC